MWCIIVLKVSIPSITNVPFSVLDVLIVNQTSDTLQNVSLELSTVGDLKLVDKPTPITLAPSDFANIKVYSCMEFSVIGLIFIFDI